MRGADVISFTTTALTDDDPSVVNTYPYVDGSWVKPGAFISMPSAARFDDAFLSGCRLVVDNSKLYEAWESEYPYPTYPKMGIIGCKFTDLIHDGKNTRGTMTSSSIRWAVCRWRTWPGAAASTAVRRSLASA